MKEKTPKPSKAEIEEMVESCYQSLVTGKRLPKEKEAKYIGLAHELRIPLNGLGNRIFVAQELLFGLYRRRYVKKSEHKAAVHRAREVMLVENAISSIRHTHKNELEFFERLPHKTLAQRQQRAAPFKSISFSKLSNLTKQLRRLQVPDPKKIDALLEKIEIERARLVGAIRLKTTAGMKTERVKKLKKAYSNRNPATRSGKILEKYLKAHRRGRR